jgi:opacity protein-like surface antigen
MRINLLLMSAVLMGAVASVSAQTASQQAGDLGPTVSKSHPIALSVGYTAMIGNAPPGTCGCFLLNGGSSEELIHLWKNIAAVAQVTGSRTDHVTQSQQGLSLVTYMAGPRYSFHTMRRLTLYGQFVIGGVHGFDSYFPKSDSQATGAANSLAFAPGGGLEIGVRDWLSIRAVEGEYLLTHLPNDINDHQHNLRISSGVVFRFSTRRLNR